jgi:membrane dipeptidase
VDARGPLVEGDRLEATSLSDADIDGIMGGNWLRFYERSFGPLS